VRVWDWMGKTQPLLTLGNPGDQLKQFPYCYRNLTSEAMFSADSGRLLTLWPGRGAWLQEVSGTQASPTKFGDTLYICSAAFSPDGLRIATGSPDGVTRIWDISGPSPSPIRELRGLKFVGQLVFSPNGTQLAAADNREVRVWTFDHEEPVPKTVVGEKTLVGETTSIDHLMFSADGRRLMTASVEGGDTRIWDIAGPKPSATVLDIGNARDHLDNAAISDDGQSVLVDYSDGTVRIFPIPSAEQLVKNSNEYLTRCLTAVQLEEFGFSVLLTEPADRFERYRVKGPPC
jgi:WD40 repeat protein